MKNQVYSGTPTSRRFALCPTTVLAGDAVLIGKEPAVALDDYSSVTGGTTFLLNGSFTLTVVGSSTHSPYSGAAIKPGDVLYASGTLDSTTNITTGLLISVTTTDNAFGWLDPSYTGGVGSGVTDTSAIVKIGA